MSNNRDAFEKRLELNSKNYHPKVLFDLEAVGAFLGTLRSQYGLETLVTDRHGAIIMVNGDFGDFTPDVKNAPGTKIRVKGRTVCHIYSRYEKVEKEKLDAVNSLLSIFVKTLEGYSEKSYIASEQAHYIEDLERQLEREVSKLDEKNDPLTGVLNRRAFIGCMKELKAREVIPVAVIIVNINDWRFFDNNYGEEESDRLIVTVADILTDVVKSDSTYQNTIIGRNEGDVFHVLIPYAEVEEAKEFCRVVQERCNSFEDPILAPSVAIGCVMKTNVEESFKELFSDAEYEMLENKFEIKKNPSYKVRLEKGLH